MAALCEKLPNIDFVMSMGLPEDAPQAIDDLVQVDAMLRGTRKPLIVAPRDGHILPKMKEMAALAGEADSFGIYAMPVPPLLFDEDGASKVIACAELGIPMIWAPAPNAGTTAPASISAVIVVANAEVLAGLVLSQAVRPGAPFVWGVGVGAMNMRTMNEVYSSADVFRGHQAQTDLARWYDLPSFAYAAHTDSKLLDEQWSAEAALTAILGELSRATLLHDVGYLECGLQSSYESIVFGDHLLGWAKAFMAPLPVDDEALALGRDRGGGAGRQPPGPALHAQALPADLAERPVRHDPPRRVGGGRVEDAARPPQGAGRGAALRAARLRAAGRGEVGPRPRSLRTSRPTARAREPRAKTAARAALRCVRDGFPRARAVIDSGPCPTHPASASARSTAPAVSKPLRSPRTGSL